PLDARVLDRTGDLFLARVDVGVGTLRCTRLAQELLEGRGRLRNDLRVLDHHDVPGHEVGARDPSQLVVGEVPRLYAEEDADRVIDDDRFTGVRELGVHPFRGEELLRVVRVVVQDGRGQLDFLLALPGQLAHFQGGEPGEVVRSFPQDLRGALHHFLALVEAL